MSDMMDVLISDSALETAEGSERSWTSEEIYLGRVTLRRVQVQNSSMDSSRILEGHMPSLRAAALADGVGTQHRAQEISARKLGISTVRKQVIIQPPHETAHAGNTNSDTEQAPPSFVPGISFDLPGTAAGAVCMQSGVKRNCTAAAVYSIKSQGNTPLTFNRSCPGLGTTRPPAVGSPPLVSKAICVGRVPMVSVPLSNLLKPAAYRLDLQVMVRGVLQEMCRAELLSRRNCPRYTEVSIRIGIIKVLIK